ncbi:GH13890 [Drosophila grimshawi]|uniref:GH13890 n=1 Tax=Drosophila grimshawi TaxID=7222 RepID=B4K068_DROGR|nr:GH13890 [Drosophila grimshawi]
MEVDVDDPLLTSSSGNTESVAAAPNSEVNPTKMDECPVLNGSCTAGVAAKKSNSRNSIGVTGHTQSHDVSIIEDDLSDLDSEITNVEEDEDNRLNTDEL